MENISPQKEPDLAPPGAGIPLRQRMLLRFFVRPFVAEKAPWEKSKRSFEKITDQILKEVADLSEPQMRRKVLVPPQKGLEDSSRYWSIAMTLEHLAIVGRAFIHTIESLSHGKVPPTVADTAAVKPRGQMSGAESLETFKAFATQEFTKIRIGDHHSRLKYKHPWFGPMTAQAWYWLCAPHQMIHLKQIQEIKKELNLK